MLSTEHTRTLLALVANSQPDDIDCDRCFGHIAEYVEHELIGYELSEALEKVQRHIEQCPCCNDEYSALMDGMKAISATA